MGELRQIMVEAVGTLLWLFWHECEVGLRSTKKLGFQTGTQLMSWNPLWGLHYAMEYVNLKRGHFKKIAFHSQTVRFYLFITKETKLEVAWFLCFQSFWWASKFPVSLVSDIMVLGISAALLSSTVLDMVFTPEPCEAWWALRFFNKESNLLGFLFLEPRVTVVKWALMFFNKGQFFLDSWKTLN